LVLPFAHLSSSGGSPGQSANKEEDKSIISIDELQLVKEVTGVITSYCLLWTDFPNKK
jgi:hypothetical protein